VSEALADYAGLRHEILSRAESDALLAKYARARDDAAADKRGADRRAKARLGDVHQARDVLGVVRRRRRPAGPGRPHARGDDAVEGVKSAAERRTSKAGRAEKDFTEPVLAARTCVPSKRTGTADPNWCCFTYPSPGRR
jgi:hypothetical protein